MNLKYFPATVYCCSNRRKSSARICRPSHDGHLMMYGKEFISGFRIWHVCYVLKELRNHLLTLSIKFTRWLSTFWMRIFSWSANSSLFWMKCYVNYDMWSMMLLRRNRTIWPSVDIGDAQWSNLTLMKVTEFKIKAWEGIRIYHGLYNFLHKCFILNEEQFSANVLRSVDIC